MFRRVLVSAFVGLLAIVTQARADDFSFEFSYGHKALAPVCVAPPPVVIEEPPLVVEEPPVVVAPPPAVVVPAPVYVPPPVVVHPAPVFVPRYYCAPRRYVPHYCHAVPCRPRVQVHFDYHGHHRRCR